MKKVWIQPDQIIAGGDLNHRIQLNFDRLESDVYEPEQVFMPNDYEWPGDKEGRIILALTLLTQVSQREPVYLQKILDQLPKQVNELGYFGAMLPEGQIDEQQLSGNGWFLRGLCEVYEWKKEPHIQEMIERVVRHLFLPTQGQYHLYPSNREDRLLDGSAIGNLAQNSVRNWRLSSDIGCAFIALDGVTKAYELFGGAELKRLIHEMITSFLFIDLRNISAQTHATLSALRGILRMVQLEEDSSLLESAEAIYQLYKKEGMTENFANYNWFGRPNWTEPCAVVDSFLAAQSLWTLTDNVAYLNDTQLIYYNAICRGQRHNGGFGCDCCAGAMDPFLYAIEDIYEAHWCCSMRGAEGLAAAARFIYAQSEHNLYITAYFDHTITVQFAENKLKASMTTRYPYDGFIRLEIVDAEVVSRVALNFFIPSWVDKNTVHFQLNGEAQAFDVHSDWVTYSNFFQKGDVITLHFDIQARQERTVNVHSLESYVTIWHGALLLSSDTESEMETELESSSLRKAESTVYWQGEDKRFSPVYMPIHLVNKEGLIAKKQIMFRERN